VLLLPAGCVYTRLRKQARPAHDDKDDYKRMLANVDHTTSNIDFSGYTEPLYHPLLRG
jgi:hypothetical protein